jgi:hypothetical protein
MQTIKNIVLTCKDITPTIFTNYAALLDKQERMLNEIELAKKELLSLGVDPEDDENSADKVSFWPIMDSEVEKQQQKIKIAQLKLSKCVYEYELLKNQSTQKFYEFQKVNSQIMEMLVYVIQEIAYKEEKKLLMRNKQNNIRDYASDDEVNEDEDKNENEDDDEFMNPDFMRTDKEKKIQSILLMITRIEPFLIIVLSVLLLIHYKPGMSVM